MSDPQRPWLAPDDELPLAATVTKSVEHLDAALAGLVYLAPEFAALGRSLSTEAWLRPGPPIPSQRPSSGTRTVPELPPRIILTRWREQGPAWLQRASHRELKAAVLALSSEDVGVALIADSTFLRALLPQLRESKRCRALRAALFATYPPPDWIFEDFSNVRPPTPPPAWWPQRGGVYGIEAELAQRVVDGFIQCPEDCGLPVAAWRSGWAAAILEARRPTDLDEVEAQLEFARHGEALQVMALTPALIVALRRAIAFATGRRDQQRKVASLAQRHVGSPFGPAAEATWRPLGDSLRKVRQWLAGQVLDIVFRHLVPPGSDTAHQTRPRREFWMKYTGSVRRMWVAVSPSIRPQLDHPRVRGLKQTMGDDLTICHLKGGPQQAIVWMLLDGSRGPVSVIEGNANTSMRIRPGDWEPPRCRTVLYNDDITYDIFAEWHGLVQRVPHDHWGCWKDKAATALGQYGIRRDPP